MTSPSSASLKHRLDSAAAPEKYSALIAIGKAEARDLESTVAEFLASASPELRSAAIRVLGFYWGLAAYLPIAEQMAWDPNEDEETRSIALMSWSHYPEIANTKAGVTKVLRLLEDASVSPRVRASAYAALFVLAGVPASERPKGSPLSATIPFEDLVDWNRIDEIAMRFGIEPAKREASAASQPGVTRLRYIRGSENKPMTHFGELELVMRDLGVADLTQRLHGRERKWNATLLPSSWSVLLQALQTEGFPKPAVVAGPNPPGTEFTTIECKRGKLLESVSYPIGAKTYREFDKLALAVIDQMTAGLLKLPWESPPMISRASEITDAD